jgi:hypothetical protein
MQGFGVLIIKETDEKNLELINNISIVIFIFIANYTFILFLFIILCYVLCVIYYVSINVKCCKFCKLFYISKSIYKIITHNYICLCHYFPFLK